LKTEAFTASALLLKRINLNAKAMKEIWKDVEGFEGIYKISSYGNLMSFKKIQKENTL